ncbi:alpha-amylase family protein [Humibacter ginsengisoli]
MSETSWPSHGYVYGVDVPRFRDSNGDGIGDLPGVLERLDYIADLGVSWIWLLPFYPSERRDNGYDVDDHVGVDERFGDLDDFEALVRESHRRGISVLVDLVIHHTSDRHRWFQEARRDRSSRYGNYYVWADEPVDVPNDTNVFPGEEDDVWTYDDSAHGWYHHQFYEFQPDLNLANPEVFDEIVRIGTTWLERGVDGFRLDAAIPAVTPKPTEGTSVDERIFFQRLRSSLAEVRSEVVLVGEADLPPEAIAPLVHGGQMDAVLDFALNNNVFLALTRQNPDPIYLALDFLDAAVPVPARVNFVRNADELDLEQLTEEERREVFAAFAPEPEMLLYGRGLRRGWTPMMGNPQRFRMTLSLLAALPGVPLLVQGQELGIGDDLSADGRDSGRPTMQWADAPAGGFSDRPDSPLVLPAQRSGPYDYSRVNVEKQQADERSNLALARALARLRADARLGILQARRVMLPDAPNVLALRTWNKASPGDTITLHNLGAMPQPIRLDLRTTTLLGEEWHGDALGAYGFAWLGCLEEGAASTETPGVLPV